eukprot:360331-Chlamydomonas_euryale.AAC.2
MAGRGPGGNCGGFAGVGGGAERAEVGIRHPRGFPPSQKSVSMVRARGYTLGPAGPVGSRP